MSDERIGRIKTMVHQVELSSVDISLVYSASYFACAIERTFSAKEIQIMLHEKCIRPATTESASLIIFARGKDVSLRYSIDCCTLNMVIVWDLYPRQG